MATDLDLTSPSAAGIATYPPGAVFGPRQMRDFEFVWLIEGDAEYRWGDRAVPAPEGSVVLCRPGATDAFRWDQTRRTRHGYFHFDVKRFPAPWGRPTTWPLVRLPADGDVLRPLFRHLLSWRGTGSAQLERLTMMHMLTAYITGQYASFDVPHDTLPPAVEKALAYLHEALESDPAAAIDLPELASAASVTPEHLCRLFKSTTGRSPVQTARLARLDRAVVFLARSNYAVKEIAHLCGFSSAFHFSRRFTEAFGHSPRAMRRRIQAGQIPPMSLLVRVTGGRL